MRWALPFSQTVQQTNGGGPHLIEVPRGERVTIGDRPDLGDLPIAHFKLSGDPDFMTALDKQAQAVQAKYVRPPFRDALGMEVTR